MIALSVAAAAVAAWLILPAIADILNLFAALRKTPFRLTPGNGAVPRFLVLVPAHNEALMLPACLEALARQDYAYGHRIVVIADNCSDATAGVAQTAGALCLERSDPMRRGKPYAIAWALEHTDLQQFDCVVIVDADCSVAPDFLSQLAAAGAARDVAVQPFNDVLNPGNNALTRMAAVLSSAMHGHAFRIKAWAGRNVPLSAGMCLGVDLIRKHGWQSFSIGEDWETYARLTVVGVPILSGSRARIAALEASSLDEGASQRRRWMLGKLWVLRSFIRPLLASKLVPFGQKLDAIAELAQPGPALQLGVVTFATVLLTFAHPPGWIWLLAVTLATLVRPALYTALAILRSEARFVTLSAFLYLPVYASWRVGGALVDLVRGKPSEWVRTGRSSRVQ